MELTKKNKIIALAGGIIFLALDILLLFNKNRNLMYFLGVLILLVILLPFIIELVLGSKKQKEKESRFLEFTRDLVENVKSGTPISKAIMNFRNRDYGALTPHVQKLINQLSIGMPLSEGLYTFAKDSKSKVISRAVSLISEAERSGGEVESVLASVSSSINQIEQLKKEQQSSVYSLIVQGYIIFIVFIIIILVLQYYLLPMTEGVGSVGGFSNLDVDSDASTNLENKDIGNSLFILLVIQSFFAGIVIGKISEGRILDGIKHAFILISITLIINLGAKVIFGG